MSVSYFITGIAYKDAKTPSDLCINVAPDHFTAALLKHWPDTVVLDPYPSGGVVYQGLARNGVESMHRLWLHEDYGWLSFKHYATGAALLEFLLWLRAYVPSEQPLFFWNDSEVRSRELEPGIGVLDLIRLLRIKPGLFESFNEEAVSSWPVADSFIAFLVEKVTPIGILDFRFPQENISHIHRLWWRNKEGTLTPEEAAEFAQIKQLDWWLTTLQIRALEVLSRDWDST